MLARLAAYSNGTSIAGTPERNFEIEVVEGGEVLTKATLSFEAVSFIAIAHKKGPIYELCRAIENADEYGYEALFGQDFRGDQLGFELQSSHAIATQLVVPDLEKQMLARLIAFSDNAFEIEIHERNGAFISDTLTRTSVELIAEATKDGPLFALCRAIRDADGHCKSLVGKSFGAE